MLPERISNNLCSLREGEDKACLCVKMIFNARGEKTRHEFSRGLMRSRARLSYVQAQAAIEGQTDKATAAIVETVLRPLWRVYGALVWRATYFPYP